MGGVGKFSELAALRYFNGLGFCLFDFILYDPVNNFSVMSGRAFLS